MAYPQEQRQAVRRSYVHERQSLTAIASRTRIPVATLRRWKQDDAEGGDCWDKARAASRLAAGGLGDITTEVLDNFARLFQSTMQELDQGEIDPVEKAESISRLADAYTKTMKAAGTADPKVAKLAVAMQVLEELAKYIRERHPELLAPFSAMLEPFGARIAEALK